MNLMAMFSVFPTALMNLNTYKILTYRIPSQWMQSNHLQLNTTKTEVLWCAPNWRQHQIPHTGLWTGADVIVPSAAVQDLGIHLDSNVTMKTHVSKVASGCFAVLRQLRSIRPSAPRSVFISLVVSLVLSRLNYGNATLAGIMDWLTDRLQSMLNAAARLIMLRVKVSM
jgi:hypothetical protein